MKKMALFSFVLVLVVSSCLSYYAIKPEEINGAQFENQTYLFGSIEGPQGIMLELKGGGRISIDITPMDTRFMGPGRIFLIPVDKTAIQVKSVTRTMTGTSSDGSWGISDSMISAAFTITNIESGKVNYLGRVKWLNTGNRVNFAIGREHFDEDYPRLVDHFGEKIGTKETANGIRIIKK